MKKITLLNLLLILITITSHAMEVTNKTFHAAYPGGVETVIFKTYGRHTPKAFFNKERVFLQEIDKNEFKAIVGVPLSAKLGTHYLEVKFGEQRLELPFKVSDKRYPHQTIKLKSDKRVVLSKQDQQRAIEEKKLVDKTLHKWISSQDDALVLNQPISGRYSGKFGLKRIYNGKLKSRHTGLDIAAKKGTPVHAAKTGKVVLAKNLFYSGNTVILDHGQGFKTIYCHMDKLNVKLNQNINSSEVLGYVGSTGRATGPHLHWTVILNGTRVNPLLFLPSKHKPRRT